MGRCQGGISEWRSQHATLVDLGDAGAGLGGGGGVGQGRLAGAASMRSSIYDPI